VRVVAATNRDLAREVEKGGFRADLYHRLAAFPIHVPPLRERREDIPVLAAHFLDGARRRLGLGRVTIAPGASARLAAADWPGNVRELENVLSRAVLRSSFGVELGRPVTVDLPHLDMGEAVPAAPASAPEPPAAEPALPLAASVDAFKRRRIEDAVRRNGGSWAGAARDLGLHRANLHHLARRLGMKS
jgi:anaerobic nitric oxide reductase transcription regulator